MVCLLIMRDELRFFVAISQKTLRIMIQNGASSGLRDGATLSAITPLLWTPEDRLFTSPKAPGNCMKARKMAHRWSTSALLGQWCSSPTEALIDALRAGQAVRDLDQNDEIVLRTFTAIEAREPRFGLGPQSRVPTPTHYAR